MADESPISLDALGEHVEAAIFLAAGAVLLLAALQFGLDSFTALETAVYPMHRWAAAGYVLTAVGLGSLFTWFDPPAPRPVRVGGGWRYSRWSRRPPRSSASSVSAGRAVRSTRRPPWSPWWRR